MPLASTRMVEIAGSHSRPSSKSPKPMRLRRPGTSMPCAGHFISAPRPSRPTRRRRPRHPAFRQAAASSPPRRGHRNRARAVAEDHAGLDALLLEDGAAKPCRRASPRASRTSPSASEPMAAMRRRPSERRLARAARPASKLEKQRPGRAARSARPRFPPRECRHSSASGASRPCAACRRRRCPAGGGQKRAHQPSSSPPDRACSR